MTLTKSKRIIVRRTNRIGEMTPEDWRETNEVSTRNRGLSRLTLLDIYPNIKISDK
jgi:hypothetical protein